VAELDEQMDGRSDVELVCLLDNEQIPLGEKFNLMTGMARGKFVSFVGDDDMVAKDYVDQIVNAAKETPNADVIIFDHQYHVTRMFPAEADEVDIEAIIKEGKGYGKIPGKNGIMYRDCSDKTAWSRELRLKHSQIHTWETHDLDFSRRANPDIEVEHRIDKVLYYQFYHPANPQGTRYRENLDREKGRQR